MRHIVDTINVWLIVLVVKVDTFSPNNLERVETGIMDAQRRPTGEKRNFMYDRTMFPAAGLNCFPAHATCCRLSRRTSFFDNGCSQLIVLVSMTVADFQIATVLLRGVSRGRMEAREGW